MKTKIEIGTRVNGKSGIGTITRIITKSTGYVEVTYDDGDVKKEMAFNLTDLNGVSLKSKPTNKPLTADQQKKVDNRHARFMNTIREAEFQDNYLEVQRNDKF